LDFFNEVSIKYNIPAIEIKFLENVINNKGTRIKGVVTPSQQILAQKILDKASE